MSSFFSDSLANPRLQLLATAVASGATVASLILGYQALQREERLVELKSSIPPLTDSDHPLNKVRDFPFFFFFFFSFSHFHALIIFRFLYLTVLGSVAQDSKMLRKNCDCS